MENHFKKNPIKGGRPAKDIKYENIENFLKKENFWIWMLLMLLILIFLRKLVILYKRKE